MMYRI